VRAGRGDAAPRETARDENKTRKRRREGGRGGRKLEKVPRVLDDDQDRVADGGSSAAFKRNLNF